MPGSWPASTGAGWVLRISVVVVYFIQAHSTCSVGPLRLTGGIARLLAELLMRRRLGMGAFGAQGDWLAVWVVTSGRRVHRCIRSRL